MPDLTTLRIGDLRTALQGMPQRWRIDPRYQDNDFVPRLALGADVAALPKADSVQALDLKAILTEPVGNVLVAEQRRQALAALQARPATAAPDVVGPADHPPLDQLRTPLVADHLVLGHARSAVDQLHLNRIAFRGVDWRNRWGWTWITSVQNQQSCQSCWAFAATALVESMTRIEHCVWSKRSEGDVHDGVGKKCVDGGNIAEALDWIKANGICDPVCWPYHTDDAVRAPTPDRDGRTVKIDGWQYIGSVADQKDWLENVGPLAMCFAVYTDFFVHGGEVYRRSTAPNIKIEGYHCVLVVGFSDLEQCWICKNSWGSTWGDNGYFKIAYGDSDVDTWAKCRVRGTNPDPWTKRRLHAGSILESGNGGGHKNFEVLATFGPRLRLLWRDNSSAAAPWEQGQTFGEGIAACPAFTATTYNRNFDAVALTTSRWLAHWFFDQRGGQWIFGGEFGPVDAAGTPGICQSDYGAPGNFELVVPTLDGKLNHWWRLNGPPWTWSDGGRFASGIRFGGTGLIQTRNRQLDYVAVGNDGAMRLYRRNDGAGFAWSLLQTFGSGVASPPCMIEGQYSAGDEKVPGNYELCVAVNGQVQHWWRANGSGDRLWRFSAAFGQGVQAVVGVLEGSFGFDLEVVVVRTDQQLQHYWRDGSGWHDGVIMGSLVA